MSISDQLLSEDFMQQSVNDEDILYPGVYHLFNCLVRSRFCDISELEEEIPGISERIRGLNLQQLEGFAIAFMEFTDAIDLEVWLDEYEHEKDWENRFVKKVFNW